MNRQPEGPERGQGGSPVRRQHHRRLHWLGGHGIGARGARQRRQGAEEDIRDQRPPLRSTLRGENLLRAQEGQGGNEIHVKRACFGVFFTFFFFNYR